ncbi:NHL repeat-containing protein [Collimonas arenae]|uniref:NHL repeat-containing protein n=1 Tax=Collimonas arenae TaxID=279058 RepID=UPI0013E3B790|nr:NHL repeat-containing protein [Collimonas arenae]
MNKLSARLSLCLFALMLTACCRSSQPSCTTIDNTKAGSSEGSSGNASFNQPAGIATDLAGNLFVSDTGNNTVRKITAAGVVTTVAGSAGNAGNKDGTAQQARFSEPNGIAIDLAGNLYVADTQNNTIRKISSAGFISTLAGSPGQAGRDDGSTGNARFNQPWGITLDAAGNLYVADTGNNAIRKITTTGLVSTIAGTPGFAGNSDGNGSGAQFNQPHGIAIDTSANLYIADTNNNTIRKLTQTGDVSTLAGDVAGNSDGSGQRARFNQPIGIAVDSAGNIRVTDTGNQLIRNVSMSGVVNTIAGTAGISGYTDGTGSNARFDQPMGIATDAANNMYVADTVNNVIRKITTSGLVSTLLRGDGSSQCLCLFNF